MRTQLSAYKENVLHDSVTDIALTGIIDGLEIVVSRIGNIPVIKWRRPLVKRDKFEKFKVSLAAIASLLIIKFQ